METFLIVLEALASLALIIVVLLQSGKKAGLSGAIAGGSETYMSKAKSGNLDQILANSTKWIALVWIVLTLVLSLI
jgi:preprotein translocase subunit SecG